jgi:hypothetical protein
MEFKLPVAAGVVLAIVVAGTGGLLAMGVMAPTTTLTMVTPSMFIFAAVVFVLGVKHGEYRASTA